MDNQNKAWALRTCAADGTSYGGFKWPSEIGSIVKCNDWKPAAECGNGLHGLLDGCGDYNLLSADADEIWQVVEVDRSACVDLGGKVKFESCKLIYSGNMAVAVTMISARQIKIATTNISVDPATSGYNSQLAASGDGSRLAASGDSSRLATSGYDSRLAASGNHSRLASSGYGGQLAASGEGSQLAASGNCSRLAASGYGGQLAASGYDSQLAASGESSRLAASGKNSIAVCSGVNGIVSAGENGCIALAWWDEVNYRYRLEVGYVGENGIKPNTSYRLNASHKFEEVK